MPETLDIGEPTDEAASLSDEQLDAILRGVDTAALDDAADREYGDYLDEWGRGLIEHIEGGVKKSDDPEGQGEENLDYKSGFANDAATPERLRLAECIADILGGILGDEALAVLRQTGGGPFDHPRDRAGRYVDKGTPQAVAMAKHAVLKVWMGTRDLRELLECLLNISVAQVRAIRDEWKLKPGKELEKRLTKVVAKLLPGKKE